MIILTLISLSFLTATLAFFFQYCLKPNMIFHFYFIWLTKLELKHSLLHYISKPLGLCIYCNGTWIAITVFIYYYGFNPAIFLFLGSNWFFIHIIYNKLHLWP